MPAPLIAREEAVGRLAEVFRDLGYAGASLAAITAGTGLGKGSLYHHFPGGKAEMAAAVLAEIDRWFAERIFEPLERDDDPAQAIRTMFSTVTRYFDGGGRICLVGCFAANRTRDRFAQAIERYFGRWVDSLERALDRGGIPRGERRILAESVVASIQGALILARAADERAPFRRLMRHQEQAVLGRLLARGASDAADLPKPAAARR